MLSGGVRASGSGLETARLAPGGSGASGSGTLDRSFEGCKFMCFLVKGVSLKKATVPYRTLPWLENWAWSLVTLKGYSFTRLHGCIGQDVKT